VLLVDAGILDDPLVEPDLSRREVAAAVGVDVDALARARERAAAIEAMGRAAAGAAVTLHNQGRLQAIGALGGSGGTAIATRAMRALPLGVPKLMVSTMASGDIGRYVGTSDVTMMHSVVDVAGINRVSRRIIGNAARALAGMAVGDDARVDHDRPLIAASMWGVTTPCVTVARKRLEELGYDVLVFHQTGSGGRSMEELVGTGLVDGVLDVTPTELADELLGGIWPAGPERLESAGRLGIPQVVSLGALDVIVISDEGLPEPMPERFAGRPIYLHDELLAGTRATPEECRALGSVVARKLNAAHGPTVLFVPLRGLSLLSTDGAVLHDRKADEALAEALREQVDRSRVEVHEVDTDLNDPVLARAMAERLHELVTA